MAKTQYLTRRNTQWWRFDNVVAVTVETLNVMSSDYRDLFNQTGAGWAGVGDITPAPTATSKAEKTVVGQSGLVLTPGALAVVPLGPTTTQTGVTIGTTSVTAALSDEVAHEDLRQTELNVTHWKVDRGASTEPRYIYQTWADGDAWSDYPPGRTAV
jgi:hypothetical protein